MNTHSFSNICRELASGEGEKLRTVAVRVELFERISLKSSLLRIDVRSSCF